MSEYKKPARGDARPTIDRLPPHSPEAEQGVLGCALLSPNECVGECIEKLKGAGQEVFYDLRHQLIYETLAAMFNERMPIDVITVQQRLKDKQLLEQVGGIAYLAQLQDAVPSAANLSYYLDIVLEKFRMRKWVGLCTEIVAKVYDYEGDVEQLEDEISHDLFKLCEQGQQHATEKTMAEVMADVQEEYLDKFRRGVKRHVGPQTGFNYLDNILPGFGPGQLILLAARPRLGKSAIMMQMATNIAGPQNCPVGDIQFGNDEPKHRGAGIIPAGGGGHDEVFERVHVGHGRAGAGGGEGGTGEAADLF